MEQFKRKLASYNFSFPKELIAQSPASPRDSARLLVLDRKTGKLKDGVFSDLALFLPKNSVLVLNKTKVIPARLELRRTTGGKVRILCLGREKEYIKVLADRNLRPGEILSLRKNIAFSVVGSSEGRYHLKLLFKMKKFGDILNAYGTAPLPPYIKHPLHKGKRLRNDYQSIFANDDGSIAAPTASLHFTKRLFEKLKEDGIRTIFITLHVGLGTFAPLREENFSSGELHPEEYFISKEAEGELAAAKRSNRPIVAVGTTVARALESATKKGRIRSGKGTTRLFIRPPYRFKFIDGLITNFHVPRSSLLFLVSALAGKTTIHRAYRRAVQKRYRLFSFGDAMLIR